MPRDGSARPALPERIYYRIMAAVLVGAVVWIAVLLATGAPPIDGSGHAGDAGARSVTVDVRNLPRPDCWYEVGLIDGGDVNTEPICP